MRKSGLALIILIVSLLHQARVSADTDDTVFGPAEAQSIEFAPERYIDSLALLPVEVNGLWGYADRRGDIVIAPQFDWTDYFYGPVLYKTDRDTNLYWTRARYTDGEKTGNLTFYETKNLRLKTMKGSDLDVGTAGAKRDRVYGKFMVIDTLQDEIRRSKLIRPGISRAEPIVYDEVLRMSDNMAAVSNGDLCGYVDRAGKIRIPFQFAEARSFHDSYAVVRLPPQQRNAWAIITKMGKIHFVDRAGDIEEIRSYHEGLAAVKTRGKLGFLDKRPSVIISPTYDEVRDFAGGLAAVRIGHEWGYINKSGDRVAWGFEGAWDFYAPGSDGLGDETKISQIKLGLVKQDGLYGYVDRGGNFAITPKYEDALPFYRGVARVKCGTSFAYINSEGHIIWDPRRIPRYGVRGLNLPAATAPVWTGLSGPDGSHNEPYPFEYDVDDHLPHQQDASPQQGTIGGQPPEHQEETPSEPTHDAQNTPASPRGRNR